ncbi:unnamed protein product [Allacma fusca]|uniref:NADP-dependent oxidoreductase domain-containing protein n=1 Tax=Allacma fusca TaxID=39272 RepID=A0A8J2JWI3_9HEXA|nr:unnamed protein product [Allacma fusca]
MGRLPIIFPCTPKTITSLKRRSYTFLPPARSRGLSLSECCFTEIEFPRYHRGSVCYPLVSSWPEKAKMPNRELIISPGNVLSKSCTWRKGNESASEELYESLRSCIEQQQKEIQANICTNGNIVGVITNPDNSDDEITESRQELKITVKLFIYSLNPDDILSAIKNSLKGVSADYLDSVVVSFAGQSGSTPLSLDVMQKVWTTLEETVESSLVKMIGLCDVDSQLFIQLYEWAKMKPSIVQINLASCCVVPPELATFTKEHDIQLLTHSDPINVLPEDKVESLVKPFQHLVGEEGNNLNWRAKWALRYQIHVKCRGVLASKGYIASFSTV